jgi:hypothetical protein
MAGVVLKKLSGLLKNEIWLKDNNPQFLTETDVFDLSKFITKLHRLVLLSLIGHLHLQYPTDENKVLDTLLEILHFIVVSPPINLADETWKTFLHSNNLVTLESLKGLHPLSQRNVLEILAHKNHVKIAVFRHHPNFDNLSKTDIDNIYTAVENCTVSYLTALIKFTENCVKENMSPT